MALSAGQQQEVTWTFDKHEAQLLRNVYTTDPVCIAAYNAICARLVGGGLVFTSETHDAVASVAFQQHIDTYWLPFAANLLRELLILGYCAYRLGDGYVPVLVPHGAVEIRWRYDDSFQITAAAHRIGNDHPDESIHVLTSDQLFTHGQGIGRHTSCVASYLRTRSIADVFVRNAMVADSALANPRVFIKQSLDSHLDDTDLMNATHANWAAEELLTKQRIMLRSCEVNQDLVNLMNRGIIGESAVARRTDARTGLQNADAHDDIPEARLLPIPIHSKIENAPQPHARADLVQLEQLYASRAAIIFGVSPTSIGIGTRSHESALAFETSDRLTYDTARKWSRVLGTVLEHLFALSFGHDAFVESLDDTGGGVDGGAGRLHVKNARVIWPGLLSPEETQEMQARGIRRRWS